MEPGIEQVQALDYISRSALCSRGDETRAPITNPPNSAQLEGTLLFPKLHPGPRGNAARDRQTGRDQYTIRLVYESC